MSVSSSTISTIQPVVISSNSKFSVQENTNGDISPAIAISDSELAYYHAIRHVLRSHKNLDDDDIKYASNYISSFYYHSLKNQDKYSRQHYFNSHNILTDNQLIMFLVYADRNGICKFALTFNDELDFAIKNKDTVAFKRILLGPKEMFVELYDNTFLSTEDRDFIIRLIARESFALIFVLELLKNKNLNLDVLDDHCISETFTFHSEKEEKNIHLVTLATKCYDEVCFQDAKILEDDHVRATMSKYEKPSSSVFTVDKPPSTNTPQVFCFNTLDLISAVTDNIPINPKTGEPFSPYSLQIINKRFHKEIAMFRRYRQIKLNSKSFS